MSVMIRGMEMPKDCKNCPVLCDYSCRVLQLEPDWGKSGRDDRCPLVPVPDFPQTKADRIRAMTDEELAEWMYQVQDEDALRKENFLPPLSKSWWLDWLKQEATE